MLSLDIFLLNLDGNLTTVIWTWKQIYHISQMISTVVCVLKYSPADFFHFRGKSITFTPHGGSPLSPHSKKGTEPSSVELHVLPVLVSFGCFGFPRSGVSCQCRGCRMVRPAAPHRRFKCRFTMLTHKKISIMQICSYSSDLLWHWLNLIDSIIFIYLYYIYFLHIVDCVSFKEFRQNLDKVK